MQNQSTHSSYGSTIASAFKKQVILFSWCCIIALLMPAFVVAQTGIKGTITNQVGAPLPYASVYIKGNTRGSVANAEGKYLLELKPGSYTVVCAFVGYQKLERKVTVENGLLTLDFRLNFQQTELGEVVVKAGAEDPAYAIIRNAIKKRNEYLNEVKQWQVMVYMKGMIKTLQVPKSIFGMRVTTNADIIDSTGKGIVYFSESLTRYYRMLPSSYKEEVVSAKVSGNSNGFGFNSPHDLEVNLYENNISLEGLNTRGFISPISDNALHYYKYKYEGSYFEDGREVLRIKVMPRRKYEPLFAGGFIEIMDGSWRLHGVDVYLNRESQIELVDSLNIRQQMFPVDKAVWMPQSTEITARFGILGIRATAHFLAVMSDYELSSDNRKIFQTRVVRAIDTAANKKSVTYWDSIRPMPLSREERTDYLKKDTLERKLKDPHYLDSLDRISNRFRLTGLLASGVGYLDRKRKMRFTVPGLALGVQYNTVEQWAFESEPTLRRWGDTGAFFLSARLRYGFGNKHFNASALFRKTVGKDYQKRWTLEFSGGKNVFQINPGNPIQPLNNTLGTLLFTVNHLKMYEKAFGSVTARRTLKNGLQMHFGASFEDRRPMDNSDTTYMWRKVDDRRFTSNYPEELPPGFFERHQALITTFSLRWQPGQQYVDYPTRRYSLGSDKPVFDLSLTKAWKDLFGADADFGKWVISVQDHFNMKLGGSINYYAEVGGFIKNKYVQLPDWRHFMGNQTVIASPFVRSFQLAPYYGNSTRDHFFTTAHIEWHLNGLLTNKVPVMRKHNWNLVTGSNAFFVDANRNYLEGFMGVENIFKSLRVDFVLAYDGLNKRLLNGIVIGISGLFTGQGVE